MKPLFIGILSLSSVLAQAPSPPAPAKAANNANSGDGAFKTFEYLNGRFWQGMSELNKWAYLIGFREALFSENLPADAKYFPPSLTTKEIQRGIDRLYEDPTNMGIPIREALRIVAMKANGVDQAVIDQTLAVDRRAAAAAVTQKNGSFDQFTRQAAPK